MKKISILLFVLLLSLIPLSNAFAYSGGLLNEKPLFFGTSLSDISTTTNLVTDNDVTTYETLSIENKFIFYNFSSPVTIGSYMLETINTSSLYLRLYDDSNNVIKLISGSELNIDGELSSFEPVQNVSKVVLFYTGSDEKDIYEFDVFLDSNVVHDELSNLFVSDVIEGSTLTWTIPTSNSDFTGSKIYRNGEVLATVDNITDVFNDSTALDGETYTYKVTAMYSDGFETNGLVQTITLVAPVDDVAPTDPTAISYSPEDDVIYLTFTNPSDVDFDKVNIYVDNVLHGSTSNGTYTITNLDPETSYSIKLTALDTSGNESIGVTETITTTSVIDTTAPSIPNGLDVNPFSNGALLSWSMNLETDIAGYNIYIDGEKDNATPVTGTSYQVLGLQSGETYNITVSAIDTSGNESGQTDSVSVVPSADSLPLLELGFSLVDVADGVSVWFSDIWLIVAFAVAIPLSFYISGRIKLMFLS